MFENILNFLKKRNKKEASSTKSREKAKERLHLVLMQDRANVSADFLDLMRQEIIEVIKKYIDIDESAMDVRLTNQANDDGTQGAPALYANIPIINIKEKAKNVKKDNEKKFEIKEEVQEEKQEDKQQVEQTEQKDDVIEKIAVDKIEEAKKIEEQALSDVSKENMNKESEDE